MTAKPLDNKVSPAKRSENISKVASGQPLSRKRLWTFRLIAVFVIPAFILLWLELGLRWAGYGYQAEALITCDDQGQRVIRDNNPFAYSFFPPNLAREFIPFEVPLEKPNQTIRIFVLGASAVHGEPDFAYSFSRILEVLLSQQYPDTHFEVINLGMAAVNSYVVVEIAKSALRYHPDLMLVYLGSNEVVGPYGAGTVFTPLSRHLSLIHLGLQLKRTRLGQCLNALIQSTQRQDLLKQWGGLGMFLTHQVPADSPELQIVYDHYRRNLKTIARLAARSHVPLVLSTVGSNLKDCPPFMSLHRRDMTQRETEQFQSRYQDIVQQEAKGQDPQSLLAQYLDLLDMDDRYAELHFRLGRVYERLQQFEQARTHYTRARELDALRLRADNSINQIVRDTAQDPRFGDTYLADAEQQLQERSPHQIPGRELFYEHVHLNFSGNYVVAVTLIRQIEPILTSRLALPRPASPLPSEVDCQAQLAFTPWDQCQADTLLFNGFILKPPFTHQAYHSDAVKQWQNQIAQLNQGLSSQALIQMKTSYQQALKDRPNDWVLHWKYSKFLQDALHTPQAAIAELETTLRRVPHFYPALANLGGIYSDQGDLDKASAYFQQVLSIKPRAAFAYHNLGLLKQKQGQVNAAEKNFRKAIALSPLYEPSYLNLSTLLIQQNRSQEAAQLCRQGLELLPDSADLHCRLGLCLILQGDNKEAQKELHQALTLDPNNILAQRGLQQVESL